MSALVLVPVLFLSCGGVAGNGDNGGCVVDASVVPATATADHAAVPPTDQVQFSATGKQVSGICPQFLSAGTWTSSDPVNTKISSQSAGQALVTCVNATPTPATISYSGSFSGQPYKPATLTCK